MIWTNKYCFSDTWQGADVACEAEIKGLCVCVCVCANTRDYVKGWSFSTPSALLWSGCRPFLPLFCCKAVRISQSGESEQNAASIWCTCAAVRCIQTTSHRHSENRVYPLKKAVFYWNTADINRLFCWPGRQKQSSNAFQTTQKKKYSWLLFSFNPTDPRDAASPRTQLSQDEFAFGPGREASLWRRGRNKNKLVLQISLGSKMLVCEVKNRTRLECWRIWKCSGLFLCPGLLLDSSSSRRSRTSVMKQGWPQLPLKTQSEHLVFPKVMLGFVKSFFLGWLQFFCAFFCRSVGALIPSFDFFSHVNQDLKTQLERMQWVWWFAYAKLPETGSDSTCRTAEGFSETKVLLQKSRLDCLTS